MANGITQGIEDILGLQTNAGTAELQQALQALQAVNVPNISQLTLPELQKYVIAGVLSPAQYQAISANPQAYQTLANQADQTGVNSQKAALQQLGGIAQTGSTPIMQAQLLNAINTANQVAKANRSANMENAQERGVAGGGLEFLNNMVGNQEAATTANQGAIQAGANNAQLALQALAGQGTLGGNVQSEANQMAQAKAQAAQQIEQYNSQLQSMANQYNTGVANQAQAANLANAQGISNTNTSLANQRTLYNAQLPTQEFNMQEQKAQGVAGGLGNLANLRQQQAQQQNAFTGNLIGAGATLGGDYLMGNAIGNKVAGNVPQYTGANYGESANIAAQNQPQGPLSLYNQNPYAHGGEVKVHDKKTGLHTSAQPIQVAGMNQGGMCYAQGGEVHDHALCMLAGGTVPGEANVPGDSPENDTVDAKLSPHEIVLPRTITQAPNAPQQAAHFVGAIKGQLPPEAGPMIGNAISQMTQPTPLSFADVVKKLEENGLELRIGAL